MMSDRRSVLFVDDETLLLQGLRRNLRQIRDLWDCEYAESGQRALELMEARHFDVIVSDMLMPNMNGAELLTAVRERFPRSVRFILSGHADPGLIKKCSGCAHQFLNKPCDFESLKAALDHSTSVALALQNEKLATLVGKIDRLPSPHAVCLELERRLGSSSVSTEEIGAIIGRDISMTAQVLRLVNSAFFGLAQKLETPQEAVSYLGLEAIRTLALCISLNSDMEAGGVPADSIDRLWRHSQHVSDTARRIARMEEADGLLVKQATTAGLLHDSGKLIMALNFPEQTKQAAELVNGSGLMLPTAETQVFGCTHAEVGAYLFALWGLPKPVVEAVARHHSPRSDGSPTFSATLAVHVADALVHEQSAENEGGALSPLDSEYLTERGFASRIPAWREEIQISGHLLNGS